MFVTNSLLGIFSMDLSYFEAALPVARDIFNIITAAGWALLLGNLVFQAAKSMMSGLGFEGEDPKTLFARTAVFGLFLLASRQICDIGLGISKTLITLLQMPSSVSIHFPSGFTLGAGWLLQIIIGFVLMWQVVKLFFEVGERYFLVGFLTLMAPLAFSMGGSRNTADIFKGWVRMFASMCLMMVLNVVFLKLLMSAMQTVPFGYGVFPWLIFVVAIARTARKIDMVITRIGLNPAMTGGAGRGLPGMLTYTIMRSITANISKAASGAASSRNSPNGRPNPFGYSPAGNRGGSAGRGSQGGAVSRGALNASTNTSSTQNTQNTSQQCSGAAGTPPGGVTAQTQGINPGAAGNPPGGTVTQVTNANPGAAGTAPRGVSTGAASANPGIAGTVANTAVNQAPVGMGQANVTGQQTAPNQKSGNGRRSSATQRGAARGSAVNSGVAGTPVNAPPTLGQSSAPIHPPIPRAGQTSEATTPGAAGTASRTDSKTSDRYSTVPPSARAPAPKGSTSGVNRTASGAAGTANVSGGTRHSQVQQGGANINAQSQTNISADAKAAHTEQNREVSATAPTGARSPVGPAYPGVAGTDSRRSSVTPDKPQASAVSNLNTPSIPAVPASPGAAGTAEHRRSAVAPTNAPSPTSVPASPQAPRGGGNPASATHGAPLSGASSPTHNAPQTPTVPSARQESATRRSDVSGTQKPPTNTVPGTRTPPIPTGRQSTVSQSAARTGAVSNNRKKARGQKKARKGKGGKS